MTCRVCGSVFSTTGEPCMQCRLESARKSREVQVLDRIIADAKTIEQPEPSFLEMDGPCGDPERDMGVGQ